MGRNGSRGRVETEGAVVRLTIDRPAKLNAINEPVERALAEAVDRLERDPALRVLVIRSRGTYFSAGYDMDHSGLLAAISPARTSSGAPDSIGPGGTMVSSGIVNPGCARSSARISAIPRPRSSASILC